MSKEKTEIGIPFGKPVRVGNFNLWQSRKVIGRGKERDEVAQINVSTLDGEWLVRIPATFEMYSMIHGLFMGGDDARLLSVFTNMFSATVTANGYYQHAISLLSIVFCNPRFLEEGTKDNADLLSDIEKLKKGFLAWRAEYEKFVAKNEPTAEDMKYDQIAEDLLQRVADESQQTEEKE